MTHPLNKHHNDISEVMRDDQEIGGRVSREELGKKQQEWADDVRKADERCEYFRDQMEVMTKRKQEIEQFMAQLEH
jgi:hypothetical protein